MIKIFYAYRQEEFTLKVMPIFTVNDFSALGNFSGLEMKGEKACPVCGEEVYDTVFVNDCGEIVGCENCIELKEPYEVFDDETN